MQIRAREYRDIGCLRHVPAAIDAGIEHGAAATRLAAALVALGVAMRVVRYAMRFPLWGDEAALAANFLDRGFVDLFAPLEFQQVCPPLFLWIELAVVRLAGFNEYTLRAFPLLCGVASVFLFRHVAGRLLSGVPLVLAVGVFSVSYYPLRHAAEVKPYASDLLASLVLLTLAIEAMRRSRAAPSRSAALISTQVRESFLPSSSRQGNSSAGRASILFVLAIASPVCLAISHPAVFVACGVACFLLPTVWRSGSRSSWLAFFAFAVSTSAAFASLYWFLLRSQFADTVREGVMQVYWDRAFPPVGTMELVRWLATVHIGQMFAYPLGGAGSGSGALAFLFAAVCVIYLFRRREWHILVLCLAPFAATLLAAAMRRYPYGGFARTAQHVAPLICLMVGVGAARIVSYLKNGRARRWTVAIVATCLGVLGAAQGVRDIVRPYRTAHDRDVRDFARRFWSEAAGEAEVACAYADLKQGFFRTTYLWRGIAQYLCNQRIYSPRGRVMGQPPQWDAIARGRPLRCVVFSRPGLSRDEEAYDDWLRTMRQRFRLARVGRFDFDKPHEHGPPDRERIEVYEFIPRGAGTPTSLFTN
jgi:hypothetical protein